MPYFVIVTDCKKNYGQIVHFHGRILTWNFWLCRKNDKYEVWNHHTSNGGVYNINACIEYIYRSEPYAIDKQDGTTMYHRNKAIMYQTWSCSPTRSLPKKSSPTLQLPTTNANQTFLYCVRLIAQLNIYLVLYIGQNIKIKNKCRISGNSATLACIIAESVCHWTNPICTEIHISDFHTVGLSIPSLVPQWSNLPKVSILL